MKRHFALKRILEKAPAPVLLLALTVLAILISGYHPDAEDGGIYIAGVKRLLDPRLYPHNAEFVTRYQHLSVFSFLLAALFRLTHVSVGMGMLVVKLAVTWLLLESCRQLARRCFQDCATQWAAVVLVAVSLTAPVAGTGLFLMDPYVTARSFSTPCTLLAICACLDRRPFIAFVYIVLVGLFHPLMSIYGAGFLLCLWLVRRPWATEQRRWASLAAAAAAAVLCGAVLQFSQRNVTESSAVASAALSRSYFYLSGWHWYEWIGLPAPLLVFFLFCRRQKFRFERSMVALAAASIAEGLASIAVALLFCRPGSHTHLIARIQPLRTFHTIYFVVFLLVGGLLGRIWLKRDPWRWAVTFASISVALFAIQMVAYPASRHLELPWGRPHNQWTQAFLWIRGNTPRNAVFALDANYIGLPGEDGNLFRAVAERSSLADSGKDGGAAAVFPQLASTWMREQTAQQNLDSIDDAERIARLVPLGATWIVLPTSSRTSLACPYRNRAVMVCRLV